MGEALRILRAVTKGKELLPDKVEKYYRDSIKKWSNAPDVIRAPGNLIQTLLLDRDKGSSQRRPNKPESKRSLKEAKAAVFAYSDSLKERIRVLARKPPADTVKRKASQSSELLDSVKRFCVDGGKPEPADTFKRKASSESERLDARKKTELTLINLRPGPSPKEALLNLFRKGSFVKK